MPSVKFMCRPIVASSPAAYAYACDVDVGKRTARLALPCRQGRRRARDGIGSIALVGVALRQGVREVVLAACCSRPSPRPPHTPTQLLHWVPQLAPMVHRIDRSCEVRGQWVNEDPRALQVRCAELTVLAEQLDGFEGGRAVHLCGRGD